MLNFRPLKLDYQKDFNYYYQLCPIKTADTSFINLWSWNDKYQSEVAFADNLCWLRFHQNGSYHYGTPLGDWNNIKWNNVLQRHFPKGFNFFGVPQTLAFILADVYNDEISLIGDRNNWEYIYNINELTNLFGTRFRNQRKLSNQFKQIYNYRFRFIKDKDIGLIRNFQDIWLQQKEPSLTDKPDLINENVAIERILNDWDALSENLFAAILEIDDNVVGYTIGEKLDEKMIVIHFEKSLYNIKGSYQAINRITLENMGKYTFVNREQDLGISGLRRAKMEYNPTYFIKKYTVISNNHLEYKYSRYDENTPKVDFGELSEFDTHILN